MSSAAAPPDSGATYARFLASDAGGWGAPPPEGTASESDSDFRAPISGRDLDNDEDAWDSEGGSYRGSQDSGSGGSDGDDEEEEEAGDEAVSGAPGAAASAGARSLPHALVSGAGAATDDTGGGGLPQTEREWSDGSLTSDAWTSEADSDDGGGESASGGGGRDESRGEALTQQPTQQQPADAPRSAQRVTPRRAPRAPQPPDAPAVVQQALPVPQEEELAAGGAAESPDLIARRTRAHVSLVDLDLEQLEKCLALDDEGDFLFDDNDEYAAFLEELQAPWDALPGSLMDDGFGAGFPGGLDEEDEGDADYEAVDPAAAAVAAALGAGGPGGAARRALPPRAPLPMRPARNRPYTYTPKSDRPGVRERPLASMVAPLRPLLPAPPNAGGAVGTSAAALMPPPPPPSAPQATQQAQAQQHPRPALPAGAAAAAAAAQSRLIAELLARGAPLPTPEAMADYIAAALAPPPFAAAAIVPHVPTAAARAAAREAAAQAAEAAAAAARAAAAAAAVERSGGRATRLACAPAPPRAPLAPLALPQPPPVVPARPAAFAAPQQQRALLPSGSQQQLAPRPAPAPPAATYAAAFTPVQLRLVRKQLHEHTQLLLQVHGLSARSPLRKHAPAAAASAALLAQLAAVREAALRAAMGAAKYQPALFMGEVAGALYCGPGGQAPTSSDDASAAVEAWWPAPPDAPLSTLLDTPSLAQTRAFLDDVAAAPPVALEPEPEPDTSAELTGGDVEMADREGDLADDTFDAQLNPDGSAIASGRKKRRRVIEAPSLPPVPFGVASALSSRFGHGGICSRALVACAKHPGGSGAGGRHGGTFSRGEDALLATGVHTYGNDYALIATWLLPHRPALSLAHRVKNVLAGRRRGVEGGAPGSAVRCAREAVSAPLRAAETSALNTALALLRPGRGGAGAHWPRVAAHVWAAGRVRRPAATLYRIHRDAQTAAAAAAASSGGPDGSISTLVPSMTMAMPATSAVVVPPAAQIRPTFLVDAGAAGGSAMPVALTARALIDAPLPPMQRHVLLTRAAQRGDLPPPATTMSADDVAKLMRPPAPLPPMPVQRQVVPPAPPVAAEAAVAAVSGPAPPAEEDAWEPDTWLTVPAPAPSRSKGGAMLPPPPRAPSSRASPRKPAPAAPAAAAPKRKGKRSAASRSRAGRASHARARPSKPEFERDIVPDSDDEDDAATTAAAVAAAAALAAQAVASPPRQLRATRSRGVPPPDSAARVAVAAAALSHLRAAAADSPSIPAKATPIVFDHDTVLSDDEDADAGARRVRPRPSPSRANAAGTAPEVAPATDDVTAAFASPPAAHAARWQPASAAPSAPPATVAAGGGASDVMAPWSAEEDRALLQAAQAAGGRPSVATFACVSGPLALRPPEQAVARYVELVTKMAKMAALFTAAADASK